MKLFQTPQNHCANVGIVLQKSTQKHPFNVRNVISLSIFILTIISCFSYLFIVPVNFNEYTVSVYCTTTVITNGVIYVNFIWRMEQLYDCINSAETIVQNSM